MGSEKALYWLAVGMMGLLLINSAAVRHQDWLSSLKDPSVQLAEQLSGGSMAALNLAEMKLGSQSSQCARTQATAARMQGKFACMEAALARRQAWFARLKAQKAQLEARQQMRSPVMPQRQDFLTEVPEPKSLSSEGTI